MKNLAFFIVFAAISTVALADYAENTYMSTKDVIAPNTEAPVQPGYEEEIIITRDYPYGYRDSSYYPLESRVEGVAQGVGTATEGAVEGAREIVDSILP